MYWRNPIIPNENQFGNTATTFEGYKELLSEDIDKFADGMSEIQRKIANEVYDNVCRAQEKQKLNFDQRHNVENNQYCKGDKVLVKHMKRKKKHWVWKNG